MYNFLYVNVDFKCIAVNYKKHCLDQQPFCWCRHAVNTWIAMSSKSYKWVQVIWFIANDYITWFIGKFESDCWFVIFNATFHCEIRNIFILTVKLYL